MSLASVAAKSRTSGNLLGEDRLLSSGAAGLSSATPPKGAALRRLAPRAAINSGLVSLTKEKRPPPIERAAVRLMVASAWPSSLSLRG